MAEKRKISLVLADVDGTLVTEEKILTEWARKAVSALQEAGIRFAITSGRPPLGMAMLFDVLDIETPIAGSQAAFGQHATANRSEPYYLDVTNKDANKGAVVEYLSRHLGLPYKRSLPLAINQMTCCSSGLALESPWATLPTRSRRRPPLLHIPKRVSPRQWR